MQKRPATESEAAGAHSDVAVAMPELEFICPPQRTSSNCRRNPWAAKAASTATAAHFELLPKKGQSGARGATAEESFTGSEAAEAHFVVAVATLEL